MKPEVGARVSLVARGLMVTGVAVVAFEAHELRVAVEAAALVTRAEPVPVVSLDSLAIPLSALHRRLERLADSAGREQGAQPAPASASTTERAGGTDATPPRPMPVRTPLPAPAHEPLTEERLKTLTKLLGDLGKPQAIGRSIPASDAADPMNVAAVRRALGAIRGSKVVRSQMLLLGTEAVLDRYGKPLDIGIYDDGTVRWWYECGPGERLLFTFFDGRVIRVSDD